METDELPWRKSALSECPLVRYVTPVVLTKYFMLFALRRLLRELSRGSQSAKTITHGSGIGIYDIFACDHKRSANWSPLYPICNYRSQQDDINPPAAFGKTTTNLFIELTQTPPWKITAHWNSEIHRMTLCRHNYKPTQKLGLITLWSNTELSTHNRFYTWLSRKALTPRMV